MIQTIIPTSNHAKASINTAMKVAFAAFLCCGEFTLDEKETFNPAIHLSRNSIQFQPNIQSPTHVLISLPASKSDPFRKGVSIVVAAVLPLVLSKL